VNQRIQITDPQHLIDMGVTLGLLMALEALESVPNADKLTGLGVARYAIKAQEAEQRVRVMQKNIRAAMKAGIDLDTNNVMWKGTPEIVAEPMDLADLAHSEGKGVGNE
jgi:hypothetical protein